MLRVLTLSTLYPDRVRPGFGSFVARQTEALAAQPDVEVQVAAPLGLPIPPLRGTMHRRLAELPLCEMRDGLPVARRRFTTWPGPAGRGNARRLAKALIPLLSDLRGSFPFDVIDAEFFWPDGVTAVALGAHFDVPVSIKARGSDINYWATVPGGAPPDSRRGRSGRRIARGVGRAGRPDGGDRHRSPAHHGSPYRHRQQPVPPGRSRRDPRRPPPRRAAVRHGRHAQSQ